MDDGRKFFTLVFEGDIGKFKNPFRTKTPFGIPLAAGRGNAFDEIDYLTERLEHYKKPIWECRDCHACIGLLGRAFNAVGIKLHKCVP